MSWTSASPGSGSLESQLRVGGSVTPVAPSSGERSACCRGRLICGIVVVDGEDGLVVGQDRFRHIAQVDDNRLRPFGDSSPITGTRTEAAVSPGSKVTVP